MKNKISIVVFSLAMWASPSMAEVEPWYTYWGVGVSDNSYPSDLQNLFDAAESSPNIDRSEIAIDMFGFYWPVLDNRTIVGGVISGTADRLNVTGTSEYIQLNQYLYGVSVMKFLGNEPGDGFFVRGDIGVAKIVLDSSFTSAVSSDSGTGFLLGIGYGVAISEKSRLILGANFTSKKIEGETFTATTFSIGGLW